MPCLVTSPLLDTNWQYVLIGGQTARSVDTFVVVLGEITVSVALCMSYPTASAVARWGMVAFSDSHLNNIA